MFVKKIIKSCIWVYPLSKVKCLKGNLFIKFLNWYINSPIKCNKDIENLKKNPGCISYLLNSSSRKFNAVSKSLPF